MAKACFFLPKYIIIILYLIKCCSPFTFSISQSSTGITTTSTHELIIVIQNIQIPSGSFLMLEYQSGWDLGTLSSYNPAKDFCESGCSLTNVIAQVNVIQRTIKISNLFPIPILPFNSVGILYSLLNIHNPEYIVSNMVTASLLDSLNNLIDIGVAQIVTTVLQFDCSIVRNTSIVNNIAQFTFMVNSPITLNSNTIVIAQFPQNWSNSATKGTFLSSFFCSSVSNPSITCIKQNTNIVISSIISSSSTTLSFKIQNIINPGSSAINSDLTLLFYSSQSNQIGKCPIIISNTLSTNLKSFSIGLGGELGAHLPIQVTFTLPDIVQDSDYLELTLSPLYGVSLLSTVNMYLNNQPVPKQISYFITKTSHSTIISMLPFYFNPLNLNYLIQLYRITLPITTQPPLAPTLSVKRGRDLVASSTCCSEIYTPYPIITGAMTLILSSYKVGAVSTHEITISGQKIVNYNSYDAILIEFDSKYHLTESNYECYFKNTLIVIQSPQCIRNSTTSIIVSNFTLPNLPNIPPSRPLSTSTFTLVLTFLPLPLTTSLLTLNATTLLYSPTSPTTYSPIQKLMSTYSLSPPQMYSVNIIPNILTTYSVTTYSFMITNRNIVPPGTIISINLPIEVQMGEITCWINMTQIDCQNNSQQIKIQLNNANYIPSRDLRLTNISIANLTNPSTIAPTSQFNFQLIYEGQILQTLDKQISIPNPLSQFKYLSIKPQNTTTLLSTTYSVSIQLPKHVLSGASLSIVTLDFGQQFTCPCQKQIPFLFRSYTLTSTTTIHNFSFPSVCNPLPNLSSPLITVKLQIDNYISIQHKYNELPPFIPSILSYKINQSNYFLQTKTNVYIALQIICQMDFKLKLTLHQGYGYEVANLSIGTNYNDIQITIGGDIIMTGKGPYRNLLITIFNITNPSSTNFNLQPWHLQLLTTSGIIISQSLPATDQQFQVKCTLPCRQCTETPSTCLSCYNPLNSQGIQTYFDPQTNTCLEQCQIGTYAPIGQYTCYQCDVKCLQCKNKSSQCTQCKDSYLYAPLQQCLQQCPPTHYPSLNHCIKCIFPCTICNSSTICLRCDTPYILQNNTCSNACSDGYYPTSTSCEKCMQQCKICESAYICKVCQATYYLLDGLCVKNCPLSLYLNMNEDKCEECQLPCLTCSTYSYKCASCSQNSTNKYLNKMIGLCLNNCQNGYFPNQNNICELCQSPCLQCTSHINCTACQTDYYLYFNNCYINCPNTTISATVNTLQVCLDCLAPCFNCAFQTNQCIDCQQNYFLDKNSKTCNLSCNSPYHPIGRICLICIQLCETCLNTDPYHCLSCKPNHYLLAHSCFVQCPNGTFLSSLSCILCTSGCLTCENSSSTCLSCLQGLKFLDNSCLIACPTTPIYYLLQNKCISCQPQCSSCLSTPYQCLSCSSPTLYINQDTLSCTSSCSSPYYPLNQIPLKCIKCKSPCLTCLSSYTECNSCFNGKFLYLKECLEQCPLKTYSNIQSGSCEQCPNFCLTCISNSFCIKCQSNIYLYQGKCYQQCPQTAPYLSQSYCRTCSVSNCQKCVKLKNECQFCSSPFLLYLGNCLSQCPQGYEPNQITKSVCIINANTVLQLNTQIQIKQNRTVFLFPASIIIVTQALFILIYLFPQLPINTQSKVPNKIILKNLFHCLLGIPQTLAIIIYLIYLQTSHYLLMVLVLICFGFLILLNFIQFFISFQQLKQDPIFNEWAQQGQGKTYMRFKIVMTLSMVLNRKILFFIFCGFWRIPITCCKIQFSTMYRLFKKLKLICFIAIFTVDLPILSIAIFNITIQTPFKNSKIIFGSYDILIVSVLSIVTSVLLLYKQNQIASPYIKYILENVSNQAAIELSQKPQSQASVSQEQNEPNNFIRSNSIRELPKSNLDLSKIQFKSVFDPNQFEDPEYVETNKIHSQIKRGAYRKNNLKKKNKLIQSQDKNLQIIDEESNDQINNKNKNKNKNKKYQKGRFGMMNNFIYWKPPNKNTQQKSSHLSKELQLHSKQIMQTIKQKQQNFNTIVHHHLIQAHNDSIIIHEDSSDSDPDFQLQNTKRAFNHQYNIFLNKNYAQRKHLE